MGRSSVGRVAGILVLAAVLFLVGCSRGFTAGGTNGLPPATTSAASSGASSGAPSSIEPTNGVVQSSDGGQVAVAATWLGALGDRLTFAIAMDTHSVDLDGYDLGELAMLRDERGEEHPPVSWESASGGHHRRGTLAFTAPDSLLNGEATRLELVIRDVAGIEERVFTWELSH